MASAKKIAPSRERFEALRAKYTEASRKVGEREAALRSKYGDGYSTGWLGATERSKLEREGAARDRAADVFFAYLQAISPRDWSYGVPIHWLYEKLTYEDAVRPEGEALSVVPPLSYGATVPRT